MIWLFSLSVFLKHFQTGTADPYRMICYISSTFCLLRLKKASLCKKVQTYARGTYEDSIIHDIVILHLLVNYNLP
jgi:hypothetical protein